MKINKLELINFRQYEETMIEFDENFNSLVGDNGSGKSTIRAAFLFGLYGFEYIVENKIFEDIQKDSNRKLLKNNKSNSEKVVVKLEIEQEDEAIFYLETELNIKTNECRRKINAKTKANSWQMRKIHPVEFERYYPQDFSKFSIVHGENLNSISKILGKNTGNNDIKKEVERITNVVELKEKLEIIKKSKDRVLNDISHNEEIEVELRKNYRLLQAENELIDLKKEAIERNNVTIDEYNEEIEKYQNELEKHEKLKDIEQKIQNLNLKMENTKEKKEHCFNELHKIGYEKAFKYTVSNFLYSNISNIDQVLDYAIPGLSQEGIDYLLEKGECICGHKIERENYSNLEKIKDNQPPKNIIGDIKTRIEIFKSDTETFEQDITYNTYEIEKLDVLIEELQNDLKVLKQEEQNVAISNDKITELKKIEKYTKEVGSCENKNRELEEEILEIKEKTKIYQNVINTKEENNSNKTTYEKISVILDQAILEIETEIEYIENDTKDILQKSTNKHLNEILKDNSSVVIGNKYIPSVEFKNGTSAPSDGQNDVISLCYLFGLMDTVKEINKKYDSSINNSSDNFPIILDGIFGKLDARNIEKVMLKIREYEGQVIMLNSDEKYDSVEKYFPEKYKSYTITREENTSCSIVK